MGRHPLHWMGSPITPMPRWTRSKRLPVVETRLEASPTGAWHMAQVSLDAILSCTNLPSLPAIAVRLLELTDDPDVAIGEIAREVQQDQALAAKVLRTVNSSFYGLSTP